MKLNTWKEDIIQKENSLKPHEEKLKILNSLKEKLRKESEKSLKIESKLKKDYLKKLEEIPPNLPKELELYWKHEDFSGFTPLLNAITKDTKGRMNFLERELGKKDKTLDWFMEEFKKEIEKK
ncbi:MAG TPA: hypothetical protein DCO64_02220 [Zunongwangia profunda]|nr:hypothetical protein [Zunongwangia profunda]